MPAPVVTGAVPSSAPLDIYATKTDQQLTELASGWDDLSADQRRALLSEVKLRMVRRKTPDGVIRVRTSRRYGRIIRQPDGSVLRIERQVVRVREVDVDDVPRSGFGVGFERRHNQQDAMPPATQTASASSDQPASETDEVQTAIQAGGLRSGPPTTPAPALRVSAPQR